MKKKICLLLLALCLLLTACGPANTPDPEPAPETSAPEDPAVTEEPPAPEASPELSPRERDWIDDIEFLREEIKSVHKDPFWFCSEEEFDWKLDQLSAQVGELSDSEIFYELSAIVSGLGDVHTILQWDGPLPVCNRLFPIRTYLFDGKLYLTGYLADYEQLAPYLLHELVAVNGVNTLYLQQKAASLQVPYSWYSRAYFPLYPTLFDWAGCDYTEGYTFQFLNDNREVESVEVPVITGDEWSAGTWVRHEGWDSIAYLYAFGTDHVAYAEGKDGGCVQLGLGQMQSPSNVRRYLLEAGELMEEHSSNKLAIDLRSCPGGYADMQPIVDEFRKEARLLEGKQIYVLTGGNTMSAATRMIVFFKEEFDAVTVGEPTGQFYSFFSRSTPKTSLLPHSGLQVRISDIWRDSAVLLPELGLTPVEEYYDEDGRLCEWENAILPDVFVYQDIEDIRQGKDSVIEWILEQ